MDRLEEIRQRAEAATPGPWYNFDYWMIHREPDVEHNGIPSSKVIGTVQASDADFIAHSRGDMEYLLSEVDRMNDVITSIRNYETEAEKQVRRDTEQIKELLDERDELTARAEAAEAERDAAVEDMTAVLKRDSDDICAYCKNLIECKGEGCECFEQGKGGTIDGKEYPDFKWTCMDFDCGTCFLLADTPCNGCFENDCSGFEWRGQEAGKGDAGK